MVKTIILEVVIHDELVIYEVAKLAKEKGFPLQKVVKQDGRAFFYELPQSHPDWTNCDAWYLPTQSLLQRWLREEKEIDIEIYPIFIEGVTREYTCRIYAPQLNKPKKFGYFNTYELALEDALKYALENLI